MNDSHSLTAPTPGASWLAAVWPPRQLVRHTGAEYRLSLDQAHALLRDLAPAVTNAHAQDWASAHSEDERVSCLWRMLEACDEGELMHVEEPDALLGAAGYVLIDADEVEDWPGLQAALVRAGVSPQAYEHELGPQLTGFWKLLIALALLGGLAWAIGEARSCTCEAASDLMCRLPK